MAGESPGKSEQRKSSGETAGRERDPRLAVYRERTSETAESVAESEPSELSEPSEPESKPEPAAEGADSEEVMHESAAADDAEADSDADTDAESAPEEPKSKPEPEPEPKPEPEGASDDAPVAEDSRLRAAVAAWVATAEEPDADADADADVDGGGQDRSSDADEAADDAGADDATPVAAKDGAAGQDKATDAPESSDDSDNSDDPDEPEAAENSAEAGSTAAAAKGDAKGQAAKGQDKAADDASGADADGSDESSESEDPEGSDDPESSDDGKGVDQATAVFRTMPRSAPQSDQPTAMLKLPPKEPTGSKGSKGAKGAKADRPESDTERTSTFVPLKPDDVRPPGPARRPGQTAGQPGRPAWAAGPQPAPAAAAAPGLPEAERTKQQPLPPKPPLDLLAELTNKPAPPETPVRTTVRRFKIWTPLVLLLLVVFAVVQFVRPLPDPTLTLSATPSYTFDGGRTDMPWPGEGQSAIEVEGVGSMGTEGAQKPAPIASMAKAMTAYVILKDHPITGKQDGPKIEVDQQGEDDAGKSDESTAQIKKGQQYTQRQMLQMLMIPSGNNVARLLGRWDAGSEEAFLKKMNAAAKDLGMTNTTYTDSSGFDKGTVSTPVDQIKLGKAVMENDIFRKIVDMPEIEIPGLPGKIYNNNKILLKPGVNGIKTGSTTPAGGNLLFTASTIIDGKERRIIGAVMNQTTGAVLNDRLDKAIFDSLKLIQKAQEVVTSAQVIKKGDVVGHVDDGLGGRTPVVATKELKAVGWPGLKVNLAIGAAEGKTVPHSGKAGDVVGEVTVGTGPGKVSAPVALQSDLVEPGFGSKLTRVG
ncbi:D-alanyl-D-alanine carboxypeptidase family protein [Streptomyces sp. NPDC021093]|uniref:D-alanyl-D-alanine carboxypeptidase family protein n=1 Tax=Streptomyces sp. NPDC021093 TaxID=3365112 RepID=UPI00379433A8